MRKLLFASTAPIGLFIFILISTLRPARAFAWGERGHHIVGYTAAKLVVSRAPNGQQEAFRESFGVRPLMFGHLNNIPDISWKNSTEPQVRKLNDPTHYVDLENIVTDVAPTDPEFLNKARATELNVDKLAKKLSETPHPKKPNEKINMMRDAGAAPWRIGQLYKQLATAFQCAKGKRSSVGRVKIKRNYFKNPLSTGAYRCDKEFTREEDLAAAVQLAGVMGHFVADLAQPYHTTVDYDGWDTGQGGIHAYFETQILLGLDEQLNSDVLILAENPEHQKTLIERLSLESAKSPVQVALNLAADSYTRIADVQKLDRKLSLIAESFKKKPAPRRDAHKSQVAQGYRSLIVERLAAGAFVLSELWLRAWKEGGKPDLSGFGLITVPYPLDVPFLAVDPVLEKLSAEIR